MATSPVLLPLEIQELIVTALYHSSTYHSPEPLLERGSCGNFETLNECTLVCRAFLRVCRRLRFMILQVNHFSDVLSRTSAKLIEVLKDPPTGLLSDMPSIGSCVRLLYFCITDDDLIEHRDVLPGTLRKLTKLHTLALRYIGLSGARSAYVDWSLPQMAPIGDAILHLLRLPTLQNLALSDRMVRFPVAALHGTAIRSLVIQGTTLLFSEDIDSNSDTDTDTPSDGSSRSGEGQLQLVTKKTTSIRLEEFHPISLSGREITQLIQAESPDGVPWVDVSNLRNLTMLMGSSPESEIAVQTMFSCMKSPERLNFSGERLSLRI